MNSIKIIREYYSDRTLGIAKVHDKCGGLYLFQTLELPWKSNQRRISCIPEGEYWAIPHNSPTFGQTLWLQDVPERSEILIHAGNFTKDTLGCILPGTGHADIDGDGLLDVKSSRKAMNKILSLTWEQEKTKIIITSIE